MAREGYIGPVGFAREPAVVRFRWVRRIALGLFVIALGWLFLNGVVSPPEDNPATPVQPSELPAPI